MSQEAVLLALQKLGLKPDPTEGELLAARESGKLLPCGDAGRANEIFHQIRPAVWQRPTLLRFERKPRPNDVVAELRRLAKACRSSARALRSLSKSGSVLIFHDLDLGDRFARAERFDDPPESLSRLRMIQAGGTEQELAGCIASLAIEASSRRGVTQGEYRRRLGEDIATGDARLTTFAKTQESLSAAWRNLSDPAMERLFSAKPLWALSRPAEKFESNLAFWRALGPPAASPDAELIRLGLLERARIVADHADARSRAFQAAWPQDNGGVSPLVGSANSRLSEAVLKALLKNLPESYDLITSYPGGAYDDLLQAVAEMASGEKPKRKAFAEVLEGIPARLAELLNRPGPKARREQIAERKREEDERRKAAREKADIDRDLKLLRETPDEFERRRWLNAASSRNQGRAVLLRMALKNIAEQPQAKTWAPPLRPIRRG
jgi:hypothetical protein